MEHLKLSYSELMDMSVMERRFRIGRKRKEFDKNMDKIESGGSVSKGGSTTLSGEALKSTILNNSLNNKIPGL